MLEHDRFSSIRRGSLHVSVSKGSIDLLANLRLLLYLRFPRI